MAVSHSYFQSLFARSLNLNIYSRQVTEPVTFEDLNFTQLEALYTLLPDVRVIEDFIADAVSKIPLRVVNSQGTEVKHSPLTLLIDAANDTQSFEELIKEALISLGLTGNLFLKRDPATGYLYHMQTSNTYVNLGLEKTLPEHLNYVSSYTYELGGRRYELPMDEMLHIKNATMSAENGLWSLGTSPYQAGNKSIKTLNANYSSRVSMIRDRGALGFISNDSELPDVDQTRMVQDALAEHGITEDREKMIVTTQKLRYQQMSLGIAELQLLELSLIHI